MHRRRLVPVLTLALLAVPVHGARARQAEPPPPVPADVPGPVWLHEPPGTHPIVEPAGRWQAAPLMVSGADAYAGGEYLFQDFVYDAHGANTTDAPLLPPDSAPSSTTGLASAPTGDVVHPTGSAYAGNAADLLEVRAAPADGGVAYRFTLNTMLEPDAAIIALGINTDRDPATGTDDWGAGIGTLGPLGLEHVLVTWGTGATLDGRPVPATVDVTRNQIEVVVPLQPGVATWRHHAVAGIHDEASHGFAAVAEVPDGDSPGGAHGTVPPPVLNVGFRQADDEPMGTDTAERGGRGVYGWGSWREHGQAKALAARDISALAADIDFGKLAAGVDESHVPTSGFMNRLFVSRLDLGEGATADRLLGPIQPYGLYLPEGHDPDVASPFTLLLHAAACNYNQYGVQTPQLLAQLEEARGSVVATPMARGTTIGYGGIGEVDTFEMWADVARHHRLDFSRVALSGISMGGIGSFRLASLYPDLFTRVFPIAGHGSGVVDIAENLRNLPLLMWNGLPDELVRADQFLPYQRRLEELGYRHEQVVFPLVDHLVRPLGTGTDFRRGAAFLGREPIDPDPRRVTYEVVAAMADPDLRLRYDGAYWVDGITLADGAPSGTVDVTDHADAEAEPVATAFRRPGDDPEPHLAMGVAWTSTPNALRQNRLEATLQGVAAVTIEAARTALDRRAAMALDVTTDVGTIVTLTGLRNGAAIRIGGVPAGKVRDGVAVVRLAAGGHRVSIG